MNLRNASRRKRHQSKPELQPLLQVMPARRVRLDPSVVQDMAAYLFARANRWLSGAKLTLSGLKGLNRSSRANYVKWCKHAVAVVQLLIDGLLDTVSLDDINHAREQWADAMAQIIEHAQPAHIPLDDPTPAA